MGVREDAGRFVGRMVAVLMAEPRRAETLLAGIKAVEHGREKADAAQEDALHAAGLPSRGDLKRLSLRIGRIRRKAKDLGVRLDAVRRETRG